MIKEKEVRKGFFSRFGTRKHDGNNPDKHESLRLRQTVSAFFKIAVPYWKTKESIPGWLQFIGY